MPLKPIQLAWAGLHALTLTTGILSLLSRSLFTYCLISTALVFLIGLFSNHGLPKGFSQAALMPYMQDDNMLNVMYAALLFTQAPSLISLFPILAKSLFHLAIFLIQLDPGKFAICSKITEKRLMISNSIAMAEIFVTVTLVLGIFGNLMNVLNIFVYSSYLRMRYFKDPTMKAAFASVRQTCDKVFLHAYSPVPLQGVYRKATAYITSLGALPTQSPQ
eukprot:TRINITY_DN2205_c0_g1_i2.p1 TRINITY_DN2205_c0_g1~~TRINITY_DN2205_c0_g1_i2.p1  ORF type:complete len:241 (+),score=34.01 TRINITY_DN2205_c0_g1_i2:68-724(+)